MKKKTFPSYRGAANGRIREWAYRGMSYKGVQSVSVPQKNRGYDDNFITVRMRALRSRYLVNV